MRCAMRSSSGVVAVAGDHEAGGTGRIDDSCVGDRGYNAGLPGGPVAQRLVQGTHNPLVLGSNPSRPTRQFQPCHPEKPMKKKSGLVVKSAPDAPASPAVENARKQVKAAKLQVKWLKAQLKQARTAVRAAKDLRKEAEAAEEAEKIAAPQPKGAAVRKKKVAKPKAGSAQPSEPPPSAEGPTGPA